MADKRKRIKLHKCFSDAQHGRSSKDSINVSESTYRVKVDLNEKRKQHLLNLMRTKVSKLKTKEFRNKVEPEYQKIARKDTAHAELRALADLLPTTPINKYVVRDIIKRTGMKEHQLKYPDTVKSVVKEFSEDFIKVTHETGLNFRIKPIDGSESHSTLQPYKFHGRTNNYPIFLRNRERLKKTLCIHYPLIRKILKHSADLPNLLIDFSKFRADKHEIHSLRFKFFQEFNNGLTVLKEFHNTIVEAVKSSKYKTPKNPATLDRYLRTGTRLLSSVISRVLRNTIYHLVHVSNHDDLIPYMKLHLYYKKEFELTPTAEDTSRLYEEMIHKISKAANELASIENLITNSGTYIPIYIQNEFLEDSFEKIWMNIYTKFQAIDAHVESVKSEFVILDTKRVEDYQKDLTFKEGILEVAYYKKLIVKVDAIGMNEYYPIAVLEQEYCKINLKKVIRNYIRIIGCKLGRQHEWENDDICQTFQNLAARAEQVPRTSQELIDKGIYMATASTDLLEDLSVRIQQMLLEIADLMEITTISTEHMRLNSNAISWLWKITPIIESNAKLYENYKFEFEEKLVNEVAQLNDDIAEIIPFLTILDLMNNSKRAKEYANQMSNILVRIRNCEKQKLWINSEEKIFKYPVSQFTELEEVKAWIYNFYHLLKLCINWNRYNNAWMDGPFEFLIPSESERVVIEYEKELLAIKKLYRNQLKQMAADNNPRRFQGSVDDPDPLNQPAPLQLCRQTLLKIEEFKPSLSLMSIVCNPALLQRHWDEMSEIAGFDMTPNAGTTLRKIIAMDLGPNMEGYEIISTGAIKELQLITNLKAMIAEWDVVNFKTSLYKDTNLLILVALEDIQVILDDHTIKTLAMRGSVFVKPYETEVKAWYEKIVRMSATIEAWGAVQIKWLKLLPIFSSKDITNQMPEEARRFEEVDSTYKKYMRVVNDDPNVVKIAGGVGLLEELATCACDLERINEGVNTYLEKKRLYFPRFFFLSNEEMLEILSETKDPLRVQPHLKKCFEGIDTLGFNGDLQIHSMKSKEGEDVKLSKIVKTKEAGANVEEWLKQVQECMFDSISTRIGEARKDYFASERISWVLSWPGQVVLTVSQFFLTANIHRALRTKPSFTLSDFLHTFNLELEQTIVLLRKPRLSNLNRITVRALIITDTHARNLVNELLNKHVTSDSDFNWITQLRYYWDESKTKIRILNSSVTYGNEYLGNTERLVITPLTDRCFISLISAYNLQLNGAPIGPASSGKTETVKDLAKALGIRCVVFNCSDGMNYNIMGKFFKGSASSGAWVCFDEFNRIEVEVLSVLAQQILFVVEALRANAKSFMFEGTELYLKPTCFICLTMNPGYAGRSELPDNLKISFRTVAMMVPDYCLIAQVALSSHGFTQARELGRKIATVYSLCSQQLSDQDHYDFSLRSIKVVLFICGRNKIQNPDGNEDCIVLKSVVQVNKPKLLREDVHLFESIIKDIFPNFETFERKVDDELLDKLKCSSLKYNLQPNDRFLDNILEIRDMMKVKQGFMLLGDPFAGKTSAIKVLADAFGESQDLKVSYRFINPKSMTVKQLYGEVDPITNEWIDGVLSETFRKFATDTEKGRKWMIFDGPVDTLWVENMNSVLDDNRKLCLTSGEIIPMLTTMSIIFEVQDLAQASPSTISRCGMIYFEPNILGWKPLVESWKFNKNPDWYKDNSTIISKYFDWMIDPCLDFINKHCTQVCNIGNISLVKNMYEMVEMILNDACNESIKKEEELKYLTPWIQATFISAGIRGLGATLDQDSLPKFNEFYRSLWKGEIKEHKYPTGIPRLEMLTPNDGLLIDYYYLYKLKGAWKYWPDIVRNQRADEITNIQHTLIPTVESAKCGSLLEMHVRSKNRMLLVGPTGTGKSFYINDYLINGLDQSKYEPSFIKFTVNITANQTQDMFISKLHKRKRGHYGPPKGKTSVVFIDDLNMPEKEVYGAQPAIELLRYHFDHGNWFDLKDMRDIYMHEVVMVAAMGTLGGCREELSKRFLRHFNVFSVNSFSEESMVKIFTNILWLGYRNNGFPNDVINTVNIIIAANLELYQFALEKLRPTPSKTHYIFNLRDFAKVVFGCGMLKKESAEDKRIFARLWIHESMRVFYDRLINESDRNQLYEKIRSCVEDHFKEELEVIFEKEDENITEQDLAKLMFGTCLNPNNYEEVTNPDTFLEMATNALKDYNSENNSKMDLVLFEYALEHLSRICRILTIPASSGLLIGINGAGRQSLTKLATAIAKHSLFQPEMSNGYGIKAWRGDLKTVLKESGGKGRSSTFLLSDHQIIDEMFLQDIDCLLNTGEVPNMFAMDEKQEVLEMVRLDAQGGNRNLDITALTVFTFFVKRCREKLHIILCFNPINQNYRKWLRTYPSLINCCTINWFNEWPESALESVASNWIREVNLTDDIKESIVVAFKYFHVTAKLVSEDFFLATSIKTYITSATYLELVKTFNHLTISKQEEIKANKHRYLAGLEKLQNAADAVATMQKDLADFQPQLQDMTIKAAEMTKQIAKETIEVEKASAVVREDEKLANVQAANSQYLKRECEADLADAIPILEDAIEALNTLKPSDITLVKSMKNPPEAVKLVMAGVCVMRDIKPDRINDASTGGKILDYWGPSKRLLGDMNFLQHLKDFDKDHIKWDIMLKIRKEYLPNKLFKPHLVAKASSAAEGLCKWIIAMDMYDAVAKEVAPKKEKLELAEKEYQTTAAFLMEKKQQLAKLEEKLANLNDSLDEAKAKQKELQDNVDLCASKLLRAEKLLGSLGGEKLRWIQAADNLQLLYDSLAGDVLICCGLIAYLSPYTLQYRTSTIISWHEHVKILKIPCSDDFDFCNVLGSDFKIQNWTINGLPRNIFSTQNAIIQDSSRRWSLLIDPQSQGNIWIKKMEKENGLLVTKFSDDYINNLQKSLEFGKPVLIENVSENLEPTMDPILSKSSFIKDQQAMIRFAKIPGPYHENFRLYLTTKLRKPHYLPQVSNKVTIINFGIMLDGLEDQLLDLVVAKERPDLQKQYEELFKRSADNKAALAEVEESILKTLSESKGDILEDESAIEVLDNSKILSLEILAKQDSLKDREMEIEDSRMDFRSIAVHSALLYYSVADLPNVDPMYQFSLEWFINLYVRSIEIANKSRVLERRVRYLKDAFTYNLYSTVCMALFDKDKLMFAFLLCTKIQIAERNIKESELKFLLLKEAPQAEYKNPYGWLNDFAWNQVCALNQLPVFTGFVEDFTERENVWKEYYHSQELPGDWKNKLSQFEQLILTKIFHKDRFHVNVAKFIHDKMGGRFINPPPFEISRSFEESTCICPLVFILYPGNDPMETLIRFAERKRMSKMFTSISLGQEQGPIALRMIQNAQENGGWVCLQNFHLAKLWMPVLECLLETIELSNTHANFRLWITSYSTNDFPISILQSSVKITNEYPSNLQQNLLRSYTTEPVKDPEFFAGCPGKEDMFARLLYGVAFFHAVVQERRTYGSLPYNFNQIDFNTSIHQLQIFINDYNNITYEAIPYLLGECNYGGKVTDVWDRRLLTTLVDSFVNKELVTVMKYKLVNLDKYYGLPRRFNYDDYLEHIKLLPQDHPPEVFGLHENAGIVRDIKISDHLLDSMILIQGETAANYNQNTDYQLMTIATDILIKIVPVSNISTKSIDCNDCFSIVLKQEINRFSKLLRVIIASLKGVQEAVKGSLLMSESLEILADSLIKTVVPNSWKLVSYPSLKNLSEYITDLVRRLEFFKHWSENGRPCNFWIPGFFNTASFIACIKQNHSRQFGVAIDQLTFDFEVVQEIRDETSLPEMGVYVHGLFLEGARWDFEKGLLMELQKRTFYNAMATVWIKPVLRGDFSKRGRYECPVYITSERRGRVSTSGFSNNFVMPVWLDTEERVSHWVKRDVALLCQIE